MDIHHLKQLGRCTQQAGRIVIAGDDDRMFAGSFCQPPQKAVVKFLRFIGGHAAVKNVS